MLEYNKYLNKSNLLFTQLDSRLCGNDDNRMFQTA